MPYDPGLDGPEYWDLYDPTEDDDYGPEDESDKRYLAVAIFIAIAILAFAF